MSIKNIPFSTIIILAAAVMAAFAAVPGGAFAGAIDDVRASLKAEIATPAAPPPQAAEGGEGFAETKERTRGVAPAAGKKAAVRAAAWTEIIGAVRPGDSVDILGEEGDWYIIDYEGKKGYVLKQDLQAVKDFRANKKLIGRTAIVKTGRSEGLPVRDGRQGDKTGRLEEGARVKITGVEGDWFRIEYEGGSGYVPANRLKVESGADAEKPGKDASQNEGTRPAGGDRLTGWLQEAGFKGQSLRVAWAIAMRESNGQPDLGPGNPHFNGYDWGLFQFNKPSWGSQKWWNDKKVLDPVYNAKVAFDLSKGGTYWLPWGLTADGKAMDPKCYPMWSAQKQMDWIWKPYKEWYDKFPLAD